MLIILETSRKEELHNWNASDSRYPLLMMPAGVEVLPAMQPDGDRVVLYRHQLEAIIQATTRRVARELIDRHADNT